MNSKSSIWQNNTNSMSNVVHYYATVPWFQRFVCWHRCDPSEHRNQWRDNARRVNSV